MPGSNLPKPWTPSRTPLNLANISAGEWVQVEISYRRTNTTPVAFSTDHFLIHVLFQPNMDDVVNHPDQPTSFGGSFTSGPPARSVYHIDPGICFQATWNGQLSVVAGGDSDQDTCVVDVAWKRGYPPRMPGRNAVSFDNIEDIEALACSNPLAAYSLMMDAMANLCDVGGTIRPMGERIWWPPVIRAPKLVPATWIQIPAPGPGPAPVPSIPFPAGGQFIEAVDTTGVPGSPIRAISTTLGNTLDFNIASGIRRTIAQFTQGGACPDGTPALWAPYVALNSATIWSTFGN